MSKVRFDKKLRTACLADCLAASGRGYSSAMIQRNEAEQSCPWMSGEAQRGVLAYRLFTMTGSKHGGLWQSNWQD